jgi:hypothetical protein
VPLMVSRRRMPKRRFPRARQSWALDSGGFTELSLHGSWTISENEYIDLVGLYADEIGKMEWAAPMDWMCEPWINEKSGLSVQEHQERTVENYQSLRRKAPDLSFIPVLQGWTLEDYQRCGEMYAAAGVDLASLPVVGIGSVCRRQQTQGGREVVEHFASQGLRLHAFGLKLTGLRQIGYLLSSSDSMAWSFRARRSTALPGCSHKTCTNCSRYALRWREGVLRALVVQQPSLFAGGR